MNGGSELHHLQGFYEPFNAISHLLATVVFVVLGWNGSDREPSALDEHR